MILGVTGTKQGWTEYQHMRFLHFLEAFDPDSLVHGDCVGVDSSAHDAFCSYRSTFQNPKVKRIIVRPCTLVRYRAYCEGDIIHDPLPPPVRNQDIVNQCDKLVAIPKTYQEEIRSGTWMTVRYARKVNKQWFIIWPDGTMEED
jgi:hypothetical protein